jgi:hypothetical protein
VVSVQRVAAMQPGLGPKLDATPPGVHASVPVLVAGAAGPVAATLGNAVKEAVDRYRVRVGRHVRATCGTIMLCSQVRNQHAADVQ